MTFEERGRLLVEAGLLSGHSDEREPQWVGLAAAAGGVFIRSQYEAWAGVGRVHSYRLVARLKAAGLGEEADAGRGIGRCVQLGSRRIYRALGMGDSRHRRKGSTGHLLQRLLALDFVVGRAAAGWLFGGAEQLAACRALGAVVFHAIPPEFTKLFREARLRISHVDPLLQERNGCKRTRKLHAIRRLPRSRFCLPFQIRPISQPFRDGGIWYKSDEKKLETTGAPDAVLPRRTYQARGGGEQKVAWFPAGWPLAVDGESALFVFPDSGEAGHPELELRTWGRHHARLWDWLRRSGVGVEAVFACRSEAREQAVRKELQRWVDSGVPPKGAAGSAAAGQDPAAELQRIDAALAANDVKPLVAQYGSIPAFMRRRRALLESPGAAPRARVQSTGTWLSGRLQARVLAVGPALEAADFELVRLSGGAASA